MQEIVKRNHHAIWDTDYLQDTYALAREGKRFSQIGKAVGIRKQTWDNWKNKHPDLWRAYCRGRSQWKGLKASNHSFQELVMERLPSSLRRLWDEINELEREENGVAKLEIILRKAGLRTRQYLFIHALMMSNFNESTARAKVNITSSEYKKWLRTDPEFVELVAEIELCKKDFFENALMDLVASRDTSAVLFANRTFNRDRGYTEGTTHKIEGSVEHRVVKVDDLGLTLEEKKRLLLKVREQQAEEDRMLLPAAKKIESREVEMVSVKRKEE